MLPLAFPRLDPVKISILPLSPVLIPVLTLTTPVFPEDEVPVVKATVPLVPSLEDTITEPSDESLCTATFAACSVV
jgi:hypothetical protein